MVDQKDYELSPEAKKVLENFFSKESEKTREVYERGIKVLEEHNAWRIARNKRKQQRRKMKSR